LHPARRQPRTVAISPGQSVQRPQHSLRPHAADMPQRVLEHTLLRRYLSGPLDVLHRAAAAGAEEGAAGRDPRGGFLAYPHELRELERRLFPVRRVLDLLAGHRAVDEDRLALDVRDAAPFPVERFDQRLWHAAG